MKSKILRTLSLFLLTCGTLIGFNCISLTEIAGESSSSSGFFIFKGQSSIATGTAYLYQDRNCTQQIAQGPISQSNWAINFTLPNSGVYQIYGKDNDPRTTDKCLYLGAVETLPQPGTPPDGFNFGFHEMPYLNAPDNVDVTQPEYADSWRRKFAIMKSFGAKSVRWHQFVSDMGFKDGVFDQTRTNLVISRMVFYVRLAATYGIKVVIADDDGGYARSADTFGQIGWWKLPNRKYPDSATGFRTFLQDFNNYKNAIYGGVEAQAGSNILYYDLWNEFNYWPPEHGSYTWSKNEWLISTFKNTVIPQSKWGISLNRECDGNLVKQVFDQNGITYPPYINSHSYPREYWASAFRCNGINLDSRTLRPASERFVYLRNAFPSANMNMDEYAFQLCVRDLNGNLTATYTEQEQADGEMTMIRDAINFGIKNLNHWSMFDNEWSTGRLTCDQAQWTLPGIAYSPDFPKAVWGRYTDVPEINKIPGGGDFESSEVLNLWNPSKGALSIQSGNAATGSRFMRWTFNNVQGTQKLCSLSAPVSGSNFPSRKVVLSGFFRANTAFSRVRVGINYGPIGPNESFAGMNVSQTQWQQYQYHLVNGPAQTFSLPAGTKWVKACVYADPVNGSGSVDMDALTMGFY